MATLREYFDTDFTRLLNLAQKMQWQSSGREGELTPRVHFDFESNATFVSCYFPESACTEPLIMEMLNETEELLASSKKNVEVQQGFADGRRRSSLELRFAGLFYIYHEADIDSGAQDALRNHAHSLNMILEFRGQTYARRRAAHERPLAFISHDSRDKDLIARPIAVGLAKLVCPVWFDEFSLKVGDRLRESIERGMKEARKCVLVITPHFLSNPGWTQAEFDGIFTRELIEQQDVILPVWHNVTSAQVYEYSPGLANRKAVKWEVGEQEAIRQLKRAIGE
jgi:hypothetical protein